jgi:NitT/TauT family transport system substrate-binding protein
LNFTGGARLHQGMVAGAVDIALGSGPDFAFLVKGAPEIGVADSADPPLDMAVTVTYDSPIKSIDDLKGKKIGVTGSGAMTHWLALELGHVKHWSKDSVTPVFLGGDRPAQVAGLLTHQVDAVISDPALGFQLEETKQGRVLAPASSYVKDFMTHIIFASNDLVKNNPDAVKRFLKGWFETIAYMRDNKAEVVRIAVPVTGMSESVAGREYDFVMPSFSADGKFNVKGLEPIARSFVELEVFDKEPDLTKYWTDAYLPGK